MTQPFSQLPQHWIVEEIKKRQEKSKTPYIAAGPGFAPPKRNPYDPSSYYREIGLYRDLSRQATVEEQRRAEQRKLEQLRTQAIDLQGIRPKTSGMSQQKGKLGYPSGAPLRNYNLTSGYGYRQIPTKGASSYHTGLDLAAPMGTPIYATHSGRIDNAGFNNGYGYNITISGSNGVQTFYGHNSKNAVKKGQWVEKGQIIGYVGSTGVSTGPHVHYEVWVNGKKVNPKGYL